MKIQEFIFHYWFLILLVLFDKNQEQKMFFNHRTTILSHHHNHHHRIHKMNEFLKECFCLKEKKSLSLACEEGDIGYIKRVMRHSREMTIEDKEGNIPVMSAVRGGDVDMARYVFSRGVDKNFSTRDNWNILHAAVSSGAPEMVRYILKKCAIPTYIGTSDGISPLHLAVFNGSVEILQILVDNTPYNKVSPRGKEGKTPLMIATMHSSEEMMKILYSAGASFFEMDDFGKNSINMARQSNMLHVVYELNVCLMDETTGLPMSNPIMIDNIHWRRELRKRTFFGMK